MKLPDSVRLHRRAAIGIQLVAICLFVIAFFLPAIRDTNPNTHSADSYPCWLCAEMTLLFATKLDGYFGRGILVIMSGWINPLTLFLLILSLSSKLLRLCRIVSVIILICLLATWGFFLAAEVVPLIGHILWALAAVAIIAADLLSTSGSRQPANLLAR